MRSGCRTWLCRGVALASLFCWAPVAQTQSDGAQQQQLYRESHAAMGTVFTLELYAPNAERAEEVTELAFEEVDRLEALLSNYQASSELSRISREAGMHEVQTDPETFGFLTRSLYWSRRSHGAFDITVGALLRAWGFKAKGGHIPTREEQGALRREVGWEKVKLNAARRTVRFTSRGGMELDPGSIGKGFAVDSMVTLLRANGVKAAFVSAGGSTLYGLGAPPSSDGWPVTVPDPRMTGTAAGTIRLRDSSLSTGACTEKFLLLQGHRYCHIFDPRTLMPVEGVLQSTVVSPSATDSDALSTVVFVLPPEESRKVLRGLPGTEAIVFLSRPGTGSCVTMGVSRSMCDSHAATQR